MDSGYLLFVDIFEQDVHQYVRLQNHGCVRDDDDDDDRGWVRDGYVHGGDVRGYVRDWSRDHIPQQKPNKTEQV